MSAPEEKGVVPEQSGETRVQVPKCEPSEEKKATVPEKTSEPTKTEQETEKGEGGTGGTGGTKGPTEEELRETESLRRAVDTLGLFSNADDLRVREQVLAKLSALCRGWVTRVSLDLGFPEAEAARAGVKLFTYGSYRLGVFNAASDIDALVVGPQHVTRNDFFTQFPDVLRQQPEATHVNPVTEAYVPVLKVVFGGIELDLQYASLPYDRIPETLEAALQGRQLQPLLEGPGR